MDTDKNQPSLLAQRYAVVNGEWPQQLPPLSAREALTAARRLYRFGFALFEIKRAFRGTVRATSGNRTNWVRGGVLYVNAHKGWHHLVHDLSHYVHSRARPGERSHRDGHAWVEREMIKYVLRSGWLDGRLRKPEVPKAPRDVKADNYRRVLARRRKWETRLKRAQTMLRKVRAACRRYERARVLSAEPGDA